MNFTRKLISPQTVHLWMCSGFSNVRTHVWLARKKLVASQGTLEKECANAHFLLPISACKEDSCTHLFHHSVFTTDFIHFSAIVLLQVFLDFLLPLIHCVRQCKKLNKSAGSSTKQGGRIVSSSELPYPLIMEPMKPWLEFRLLCHYPDFSRIYRQ